MYYLYLKGSIMEKEALNQLNAITLKDQLYSIIKKQIQDGTYKPGEKIPSELELKKIYSVSRVTVRNVLQKLVEENILVKKRGKGTFVNTIVHTENVLTGGSFTETYEKMGQHPSTKIVNIDTEKSSNDNYNLIKDEFNEILVIKRVREVDKTPCIFEIDYLPTKYKFLNQLDGSLLHSLENKLKIKIKTFEDHFQIIFSTKENSSLLNCPVGTPLLEVTEHVYDSKSNLIYINKQYILTTNYIYAVRYQK